jgi:hypothetical protein
LKLPRHFLRDGCRISHWLGSLCDGLVRCVRTTVVAGQYLLQLQSSKSFFIALLVRSNPEHVQEQATLRPDRAAACAAPCKLAYAEQYGVCAPVPSAGTSMLTLWLEFGPDAAGDAHLERRYRIERAKQLRRGDLRCSLFMTGLRAAVAFAAGVQEHCRVIFSVAAVSELLQLLLLLTLRADSYNSRRPIIVVCSKLVAHVATMWLRVCVLDVAYQLAPSMWSLLR